MITVRRATVDDGPIVAELVHALLDELSGGNGPDSGRVAADTKTVLTSDDVTALLAFDGAVPVGVMTLNQCVAIYAGGRFGEISELYVRPDYRSKGVAVVLMKAAAEEGKRRNWRRLEVGAPPLPEWRRTVEFYLREGFEEVGPRLRKLL